MNHGEKYMDNFVQATPGQPEEKKPKTTSEDDIAQEPRLLDTLRESTRLVNGLKWPIFKRVFIFLLLAVFVPLVFTIFLTFIMPGQAVQFVGLHPEIINITMRMLVLLILMIIWTQMIMLGVKHTLGLPGYLEIINTECLHSKWELLQLFVLVILMNCLVNYLVPVPPVEFLVLKDALKIMALYLIYWVITIPIVLFAIPHVITQKQTAITALTHAYRNAASYWKKIIVSYGVLYLAMMLTAAFYIIAASYGNKTTILILMEITLMIICIWLIPLYVTLASVLFRDAYGLKSLREKG